jgi:hypothetical protein
MGGRRALDRTGLSYGWLVCIELLPSIPGRKTARWLCRCKCGAEIEASATHLASGGVKSCGCIKKVNCRGVTKHGEAGAGRRTPEYISWYAMINRCECESDPRYSAYGGRGIKVCRRWRNDYAAFLSDMGRRPSAEHSLDRINVNGNYEPDNCRWADRKTQAANKRVKVYLDDIKHLLIGNSNALLG